MASNKSQIKCSDRQSIDCLIAPGCGYMFFSEKGFRLLVSDGNTNCSIEFDSPCQVRYMGAWDSEKKEKYDAISFQAVDNKNSIKTSWAKASTSLFIIRQNNGILFESSTSQKAIKRTLSMKWFGNKVKSIKVGTIHDHHVQDLAMFLNESLENSTNTTQFATLFGGLIMDPTEVHQILSQFNSNIIPKEVLKNESRCMSVDGDQEEEMRERPTMNSLCVSEGDTKVLPKIISHVKQLVKVPSGPFYAQYDGHPVSSLAQIHAYFSSRSSISSTSVPIVNRYIFLAGDSSLDNKHWFFKHNKPKECQLSEVSSFTSDALNGYEHILQPARSIKDICFHLNLLSQQYSEKNIESSSKYQGGEKIPGGSERYVAINTAIEATTIADRDIALLPQDEFIRDHISNNDVLIVSIGGNDVALRPTKKTTQSLGTLIQMSNENILNDNNQSMKHLEWLFKNKIESYIEKLISKTSPKHIIICMIYYLDENPQLNSWASDLLQGIGYDQNPSKVQFIIRTLFSRIKSSGFVIPGCHSKIDYLPLFEVLDGKLTSDYVQRVEPSVTGGFKIASALFDCCMSYEKSSLSPQSASAAAESSLKAKPQHGTRGALS